MSIPISGDFLYLNGLDFDQSTGSFPSRTKPSADSEDRCGMGFCSGSLVGSVWISVHPQVVLMKPSDFEHLVKQMSLDHASALARVTEGRERESESRGFCRHVQGPQMQSDRELGR